MKKFIYPLLALVLALSLGLVTAVPVAADPATLTVVPFELQADGAGTTAEWATAAAHTGSWGVNIGTASAGTGAGRVAFAWNQKLSTITDMSYWYNLQAGNGAPNWDAGPYMNIEIDTTGDGNTDSWVLHKMFALSPGIGTWLQWKLSDDPLPAEHMEHDSTTMWHVWDGSSMTDYALWPDVLAVHGDDMALKIKIAVGDWASDIETRHYVDDIQINGVTYYGKIQDAIDSATAGDTIMVYDGTYNEQVFISKENLTVESVSGNATTIIDGTGVTDAGPTGHSSLVWLQKDGITFKGFTVQNYQDGWQNGGLVRIHGWDGTNWAEGISGCLVTENKIVGATVTPSADNIIIGYGADGNTVSNNELTNSDGDGIIISSGPDCVGNQITGNTITDSTNYGVSLCTDSWGTQRNFPGTVISGNTISGGTNGIGILYATGNVTSHIVIQNNTISGVTTGDGEGIELYHGAYVDILYNTLGGNLKGVQVKEAGSTNVVVNYNDLSGNTNYGLETANLPETVDAQYNWWGATTGPDDDGSKNPYYAEAATAGADKSTTTNVDFLPWMIHDTLVSDWNIWSTPIAVDASTNTITEALDFWDADSTKVTAAYYFDSSASPQVWTVATSLTPLQAVYLNLSDTATIDVCVSDSNNAPPARTMYQGWNLVGPAELYDMHVDTAVSSALYGTGEANLVGYNHVISPSIHQATWTFMRGDTYVDEDFVPTAGYWVYMVNQGSLAGFTYTPITLLP